SAASLIAWISGEAFAQLPISMAAKKTITILLFIQRSLEFSMRMHDCRPERAKRQQRRQRTGRTFEFRVVFFALTQLLCVMVHDGGISGSDDGAAVGAGCDSL